MTNTQTNTSTWSRFWQWFNGFAEVMEYDALAHSISEFSSIREEVKILEERVAQLEKNSSLLLAEVKAA